MQQVEANAILHKESRHKHLVRRFPCGPWIFSAHCHSGKRESSSRLWKAVCSGGLIPSLLLKQGGQRAELYSSASYQHSTVNLLSGAVTPTCWGNTMDHQLDVPVYLSHRAGRVHATAGGCVQRGTRTLKKKKQSHGCDFHMDSKPTIVPGRQQGKA